MKTSLSYDSNVMKRLIADVVHKIKNGLGGISGYATLLEREFSHDDPRIRFIKKINDGVIGVNEVSIKLMSLVRIRELQKDKIKIEYLFREILKNISDNDENIINKLYFDNNFQGKYIEIVSDQDLLGELFKNSIQFIQLIDGEIIKIQVNPLKDKNLSLQIYFKKNFDTYNNFSDYINNLMHESRYLHERLSFAIMQNMINLLHGNYSTLSENDGVSILKFEI